MLWYRLSRTHWLCNPPKPCSGCVVPPSPCCLPHDSALWPLILTFRECLARKKLPVNAYKCFWFQKNSFAPFFFESAKRKRGALNPEKRNPSHFLIRLFFVRWMTKLAHRRCLCCCCFFLCFPRCLFISVVQFISEGGPRGIRIHTFAV